MTTEDTPTPGVDEKLMGVLAANEIAAKPFPCTYAGCAAAFDSPQALSMHTVRVHTGKYGPKKKANKKNADDKHKRAMRALRPSPSNTTEYKRRKYLERVAGFRARGLTAQGLVPKAPLRGNFTGSALANIQKAQRLRRMRERANEHLQNGAAPAPQPEQEQGYKDSIGEAARAIIVAAQVLRSVGIGLKL